MAYGARAMWFRYTDGPANRSTPRHIGAALGHRRHGQLGMTRTFRDPHR